MTPKNMIGRTIIGQPRDNGERRQARIVKDISDHDKKLEPNPELVKFLCSFNDDQYEEKYAYNDIIKHIEKENTDPDVWKFKYNSK